MLSGAGGGPVVVNSSTATLNDLTVTNGSGGIVGGIYNTGTLTITNSTIANNSGSQSGGIYNGTSTLYPTITITDSTISGNTGAAAGGIYNYGVFDDVTITDDTISGNVATGSASTGGGAINDYGNGDGVEITASTISGNAGLNGAAGGLYGYFVSSHVATYSIGATIVAGNNGGNCAATLTDPITYVFQSVGYNLTNDPTSATCGFSASTDLVNKNPDLGACLPTMAVRRKHCCPSPPVRRQTLSHSERSPMGSTSAQAPISEASLAHCRVPQPAPLGQWKLMAYPHHSVCRTWRI